MVDIIPFPTPPEQIGEDEDVSNDLFLLNEGLDLLADFRAIEDQAVRDSIRRLVRSMAQSTRGITGSP